MLAVYSFQLVVLSQLADGLSIHTSIKLYGLVGQRMQHLADGQGLFPVRVFLMFYDLSSYAKPICYK